MDILPRIIEVSKLSFPDRRQLFGDAIACTWTRRMDLNALLGELESRLSTADLKDCIPYVLLDENEMTLLFLPKPNKNVAT